VCVGTCCHTRSLGEGKAILRDKLTRQMRVGNAFLWERKGKGRVARHIAVIREEARRRTPCPAEIEKEAQIKKKQHTHNPQNQTIQPPTNYHSSDIVAGGRLEKKLKWDQHDEKLLSSESTTYEPGSLIEGGARVLSKLALTRVLRVTYRKGSCRGNEVVSH